MSALVSEEFDVTELFPTASTRGRRRSVSADIPWRPLGHVALAAAAAVAVWLTLPVTLGHVSAPARVGVAALAGVIVGAVWARLGAVPAVGATVAVSVLAVGAGALAFYAPVAVAVAAAAAVAARAPGRKRDGDR